jgi:sugar lactone lactonase YvrE
MRAVSVLGVVAAAVVANACSKEVDSEKSIAIDPVANDPSLELPVDATPSPDGTEVYFIASKKAPGEEGVGIERRFGIYKVSAAGGAITALHEGDPLVSPFGITISDDGRTLFIADSAADTSEDRSDGRVYAMLASGGTPSALAGTESLAPGGVEAMADSLYITGKKDGKAGLFKTGLLGGNVTTLASGDLFTDPSGVAVTKKGEAFVVSSGSATSAQSQASVVKVMPDGKTELVIEGISVGHPAGAALSLDESTLFVSGLDNAKGTDVVFKIDLASREVTELSEKIADFTESAGLHRARNADVFAWADSHANRTGTVYVLRMQ